MGLEKCRVRFVSVWYGGVVCVHGISCLRVCVRVVNELMMIFCIFNKYVFDMPNCLLSHLRLNMYCLNWGMGGWLELTTLLSYNQNQQRAENREISI